MSRQRNMTQLSPTCTQIRASSSPGWRNDALSEEASKFRSQFPNLPGFRRNISTAPQSPKKQSLNYVNGFMMVNSPLSLTRSSSLFEIGRRPMTASAAMISKDVTDPNDIRGRYSYSRRQLDREINQVKLPFFQDSKLPAFLEHDRKVLLFNAYYEEDVYQSALEVKRVHTCEIFFYVEDGTIEIIQSKQENSGIPQGVFLRRSRIAKPGQTLDSSWGNTAYYEIDDLKLGNIVEIYSRKFHIVNCNESTKKYALDYHNWKPSDVTPVPLPRDHFAEANSEKMRRESGVPGVDRNRKMNDLKQVMESMLGKQTSTTDRGMFLECGQNSLCFCVIWDDRKRLYGDIQYFKLFYFLADDTIEILPVHKKNNGRDQFPKLLKRSKLPKNGSSGDDPSSFYSWRDITIGKTINVFGRSMTIATCDKFTRDHYLSKGIELDEDLPLEAKEDKLEFKRQIPPYNGFGSEEDSLRSCTGGINPPPPKKDLAKMREKSGVILRFNAHLISDKVEDKSRRFVIQYFMEDDTIAIREPPICNSGVMGGSFLRRQVLKKADGTRYTASDLYVGNIVDFVSHRFVLLNADEYTYRLMENDENMFPYSNFSRLHGKIMSKKDELKKYFVSEYRGNGTINMDEFSICCEKIDLNLTNKQELITLWRKINKKNKERVSFTKVVKLASEQHISYRWSAGK